MANINSKEDKPCTIEELMAIITAPTGGFVMLPNTDCDEVFPGIILGDGTVAKSPGTLKKHGITHIVNTALGKTKYHVNSNHVMYRKYDIIFKGIEATDHMSFDLTPFFDSCAEFIHEALKNNGKVYVHCVQGVSRSATITIAYLMIKQHMTVRDALRLVRSKREVCPNDGFLEQLCKLNTKLTMNGHFKK
ncbi:dual specificity protein phosphatase 3 isoform X2 [Patella vulgata]|uniref:dual specificity protein phosphatase 3 isoform X2 n=1 Tax=Patella vulgata TaxID=6465 RepID=UPI00218001BD|nr:dual specificity protein phosphatase 3 isoform X2 [Patella vulgata]